MSLKPHLGTLPDELGDAIDETYGDVASHYVNEEWDDAQVDAGRFCEAVLRVLEWHTTGSYTPIDGKSSANRKAVVHAAREDKSLAPSLRAQIPQGVELIMDFRNNRNTAHLGDIDANQMDAACVYQATRWITGELVRLESEKDTAEVQALLDQLAEREIPLIQTIGEHPIVLDTSLSAPEKALVLLYQQKGPVGSSALRGWVRYSNSTRWRTVLLAQLEKNAEVFVDGDDDVHLLRPGAERAEELLRKRRSA